jgi:hypothetical protein
MLKPADMTELSALLKSQYPSLIALTTLENQPSFLSVVPLLNIPFLCRRLRPLPICNSNVLFGSDVPIYFNPEFPILLSLFVSSYNLFIYNDETVIHFNHSNGTEGKNREMDA